MKAFTLLLLVFTNCYCLCLQAQRFVVPAPPQSWTFPRIAIGEEFSVPKSVAPFPNMPLPTMSLQNQSVMRMVNEDIAYHAEIERRKLILNHLIYKGFPSWEGEPGTECFYEAYKELSAMLSDSIPLNIERAVFLIENAYLGNKMRYSDFQNEIRERVQYCQWRLNDLKINPIDDLSKNMAIFSLLTDTLSIHQPGSEKTFMHYPLKYNLDDYDSQRDYTSHFVSSMFHSNLGQCYSMPLLYLMMAERMDAEAYLSYAPKHMFIKIKDDKGAWYNLELTCRSVLSDYHYMNGSYIKSEAVRNGLYLVPVSKKETVAMLLAQLGRYYRVKYGYDPFIIKCAGQSEWYAPNSIDAKIIEADYQTVLTMEIAHLLNAYTPDVLKEISPDAYLHYVRMHQLYKEIDDCGYEEMPVELYQNWLKYVTDLKEKEKADPQPRLRKMVK